MANRFWVGGTGNWSDTAHWSATSGGGGGQTVPTNADNCLLDANSGSGTVTITSGAVCRNFNCTAYTGTVANTNVLTIGNAVSGAFVLSAAMTLTGTAGFTWVNTVAAGALLLSGGQTLGPLTFNGAGGSWQFGDAFNVTGGTGLIALSKGSLDTNGQTVLCAIFNADNANTRSLTLGASTITCTNSWNITTTTGLTFNAGTSTIVLTGSPAVMQGGSLTYNNVTFQTGSGTKSLHGANTFANLTCLGAAGSKTEWLSVGNNQTVTGTLTLSGNAVTNRLLVRGASATGQTGQVRTITSAANTFANLDFQDITGAGAASWNLASITGNSGDAGGNSGITFTTAAAQTWSGTSGGNWSANAWTTRVPLPQDDVTVNAAFAASQTITVDMSRMGKNVDFTGVTGSPALTFAGVVGVGIAVAGSLTLAAGLGTVTINTGLQMAGHGSHTLTSAGKTFTGAGVLQVTCGSSAGSGTYTLQDGLTITATSGIQVLSGTLTANGFDVTSPAYTMLQFLSVTTPTVNMGTGTWSITGTSGTVWNVGSTSLLTLNPSTSTIVVSTASSSARTFAGAGQTYNDLRYTVPGSTGALIITGANTFNTINVSGPSPHTLTLPASTTTVINGDLILHGVPGSLTVLNSSVAGTAATVSKAVGLIQPHFASIKDNAISGFTVAETIGGTLVSGTSGWVALPAACFGMELGYAA